MQCLIKNFSLNIRRMVRLDHCCQGKSDVFGTLQVEYWFYWHFQLRNLNVEENIEKIWAFWFSFYSRQTLYWCRFSKDFFALKPFFLQQWNKFAIKKQKNFLYQNFLKCCCKSNAKFLSFVPQKNPFILLLKTFIEIRANHVVNP